MWFCAYIAKHKAKLKRQFNFLKKPHHITVQVVHGCDKTYGRHERRVRKSPLSNIMHLTDKKSEALRCEWFAQSQTSSARTRQTPKATWFLQPFSCYRMGNLPLGRRGRALSDHMAWPQTSKSNAFAETACSLLTSQTPESVSKSRLQESLVNEKEPGF